MKKIPPPDRLVVISHLHVKENCIGAFLAELKILLPESAKEPGLVRYEWLQSRADPGRFTFVDMFRDQAAFDAHVETAHIQRFAARVADFLIFPPVSEFFASKEIVDNGNMD